MRKFKKILSAVLSVVVLLTGTNFSVFSASSKEEVNAESIWEKYNNDKKANQKEIEKKLSKRKNEQDEAEYDQAIMDDINNNQIATISETIEGSDLEQSDVSGNDERIAVYTLSSGDGFSIEDFKVEPVNAPYNIANNDNESVSLATGGVNFAKTLISLPGRNGIDFSLGVKYSSDNAVITKSEYENTDHETISFNNFAIGWMWDLPYVSKDNNFYGYKSGFAVTLSDSSSYKLMTGTTDEETGDITYSLKNCTDDFTFVYAADTDEYVLNYPNGTKEYFDKTYGTIKKREDRFGNEIVFEYEELDYFRGSYIETIEGFSLYSKKLHVLSKIYDDTGRMIDIEYTFSNSSLGKQLSRIEIKVSNTVYATIGVKAEHCFNGNINVVSALTDGEGYKTKFEYDEKISRIVTDTGIEELLLVNSSAFMLRKIAHPTGGYTEYEYDRIKSSYCYQQYSELFTSWYENFKIVSRRASDGELTTYEYVGDRSGYPKSYLVNDVVSNDPTGYIKDTGVKYSTIVSHNGISTIHTFNYKHNKVQEITYDTTYDTTDYGSGAASFSFGKECGLPEWKVIINNKMFGIDKYEDNLYIIQGEKFVSSIKLDVEIENVKTYGDKILILCNKSGRRAKIFNTTTNNWERDCVWNQVPTFENVYYVSYQFYSFSFQPENNVALISKFDISGNSSYDVVNINFDNNEAEFICINSKKIYFKIGTKIYEYDTQNDSLSGKSFVGLDISEPVSGFTYNQKTYVCTPQSIYEFNFEEGSIVKSFSYPTTYFSSLIIKKDGAGNIYAFSLYQGEEYNPCVYKFVPTKEFPWELVQYRMFGKNTEIIMGYNEAYILVEKEEHRIYEKINFVPNSLSTVVASIMYTYDEYNRVVSKKYFKADRAREKFEKEEIWVYETNAGAIKSYTDILGNKTSYEYSDSTYYLPTKITKYADTENAQVSTFELSTDKKKVLSSTAIYDNKSLKTVYTYDTIFPGSVIEESVYEIVDEESTLLNTTQCTYDDVGLYITEKKIKNVVTNNTNFEPINIGDVTYGYSYNSIGLIESETDPENRTTSYAYNKNGWLTRIDYPDNTFITKTYTLTGDINKITTSYNDKYYTIDYFNGVGKCLIQSEKGVTAPETILKEYFYDNNGDLCATTVAPDVTSTYYLKDGYGRLIYADMNCNKSFTGDLLRLEYDDYELSETITIQGDAFNYDDISIKKKYYDVADRVVKIEQESNAGLITIEYVYDYMGNLVSTIYPDNKSDVNTYNDLGQLISTKDRAESVTLYEYDSYGNVCKITYSDGTVQEFEYDNLGRLLKSIDAMGTSEYYSYDLVGNVVSFKDKKAQTTDYIYDDMSRLLNKQCENLQVSYEYDDMGNVLTMSDSTGTTTYTYQYNNLCTGKTTPDNKTITYSYYDGGNISKIVDYEGNVISYKYDGRGNITNVYKNNTEIASYYYNVHGSIVENYDGHSNSYMLYEYDNVGRLINQNGEFYSPEGELVYYFSGNYTYDLMGNQIQKSENNNGEQTIINYTYDELGRLTSETAPDGTVTSYTYNNSDNMTAKSITHPTGFEYTYSQDGTEQTITDVTAHNYTYTYNNLDQLLSVNEQITGSSNFTSTDTYTYDANGNTLSKQTAGSAGTSSTQYAYNAWNQLTQFTAPDSTITTYGYDGTGVRVSKTQGDTVKKFYWDRSHISNESTNGAFTATNYIGPEGIFARETADDTDYMLRNGHGDIVASISEEDFTVTKTYDYDAYGVERNPSESDDNPFRYCGEYYDEESGLIYLRNRYYDPSIGRFITEDPVKDGTNWYVYCGNNPVNFVDPWGMFRIFNGESIDRYEYGDGNIDNIIDGYIANDIMVMQMRLQELGYLDPNISWYGYFGDATLNAVNSFKNDYGLQNDTADTNGVVGATTWAYLGLGFDVLDEYSSSLINVRMERGALHINTNEGNISDKTMTELYLVSKSLKSAYKHVYGEKFNVSTDSLWVEIIGHLFVGGVSTIFGDSIANAVQNRTAPIDIGDNIIVKDSNRKYWDLIAEGL